MKKNTKKSFSQRAQDLVKRYSRASWDTNEKRELDNELQKLQQEQEQYKQVNKIGEYSDEAMAQKAMQQQEIMVQQSQGQFPQGQPQMQPDSQVGQMPQFELGGGFKVPQASDYFNTGQTQQNAVSTIYPKNVMYPIPQDSNIVASQPQQVIGQDQQIGQTQSVLPSVIAGGIGMLGNIALGATTKAHPFDFKQRYNAEQISLAKERERLNREAITARNIGMRNLSGAGSRDAYLAGAGNVSAGINQQLSDSLSQSYFKEGMTNMGQREKAYDKNFDLDKQIAMMNYQDRVNADNERRGYYAAAAQIPSQTMQDIGRINYQNSALLSSGTDNYLAGTSGKANPWKSQQIYRKFKK